MYSRLFFFKQPRSLEKYIIIVAGGSGSRMKSELPKQFIELNGLPILMHTIMRFRNALPIIQIMVALSDSYREQWEILCTKHNFIIPHTLCSGGETRFHSVKNALELVPTDAVVGIHDAARPLVSTPTILNTFEKAEQKGNAIPAIAIFDSIRKVENEINKAVDRNDYRIIQTPQCFHSNLLKKAFLQPYQALFTDDASVLEAMGEKINLVEGNKENIKITTSEDLILAKALI
jgi:2-C-methyl-D-erythritol 4-phosphate cytidylyltransferase